MLRLPIQGLQDGQASVNLMANVRDIDGIFPEFSGEITLTGTIRKVGKRYSFKGEATCMATMICDRTLNEFTEKIIATVTADFLADTQVYLMQAEEKDGEMTIIRDDELFIDLSNEVRQELALSLPMKRVAPEFRDKEWEDIAPEIATGIDDRWKALKGLTFNN
ncbi:MAG: DUF177 domain-containing protein [Ignavibacteria bacterium]|nr:DUF177 domain-containing protein [Ignavibacteria bacterium]